MHPVPGPVVLTRDPARAASHLREGKLVAFPTETVYGLGADAYDTSAVLAIFEAKCRPRDNPLIVHVATLAQLRQVASSIPPLALGLIEAFFPGPLTLILPRHPELPAVTTGGLDTVAVRMPAHTVARAFLAACNRPVAAPSANVSGRPTATTWRAVLEDLRGSIACLLRDDGRAAGLESTVVDCTGNKPVLLRPGVVSLEALRQVAPATVAEQPGPGEPVRSPGMHYRHYAPHCRIHLVRNPGDAVPEEAAAYIGLDAVPEPAAFGAVSICADAEAYARTLFRFFRRCDRLGISDIYCQTTDSSGIGRALMDRLCRASGSVRSARSAAVPRRRLARQAES